MLIAFALVALLAAQFRILQGFEPYWYGAGVPLLAAQVLIAFGIAVAVLRLETWSGKSRLSPDVLFFALIWILAAVLWASRTVPPSYWITAPRPPNLELYPFSDSATYDLASQFALIGQGIFNGMPFDRALYMSFLVYLHLIGGQDYLRLMAIQAAVFAVFPAVLYLIGRKLHSRTAGFVFAALITMRGLTSLDASAWIDTANFKHMLTDFPTAIGVAVALFLVLKWLDAPDERRSSLMWAGGVLGLTSLLRPHVLILVASTAVLVLWVYRSRLRRGAVAAALVFTACLMGVLPWLAFGPSSGSLVTQYGDRMRAVIAQRFPGPTALPVSTRVVVPTAAPAVQTPVPQPSKLATPTALTAAHVVLPPLDPGPPFVVDHFLHNLIASGLIFPSSPQLLSVRSVVKEGEAFWRPRWSGDMSTMSALMLILNLVALAFGVGIAAHRDRLRGLLPLLVLLLYLAVNSLARTSGGRYIVPVDWILILYFSIAVAELVREVAASWAPAAFASPAASRNPRLGARAVVRQAAVVSSSTSRPPFTSHPFMVLTFVLLIGGLVPLAGVPFPKRYALGDVDPLIRTISQYAPGAGTERSIRLFLQNPDAVLTEGRLLYPLHYRQGEGEPTRYAPYTTREFPRTVFVQIGPRGLLHVVLPGGRTPSLPDASDVIVLGCRVRGQAFDMVQAVAVVLPDRGLGFVRDPSAPLTCPMPDPVCGGNGTCR
jgi:hypothetical protein